MAKFDTEAKDKGVLILNEVGEAPGLDHLEAKRLIDEIKGEGGTVLCLNSYGAGLPSFEHNTNPLGFKFSWSPKGLIAASRVPAVYIKNGKKVKVPGESLFDHFRLVEIDGLGTFETYPNRDSHRYLTAYGLDDRVSLFRGLLRFPGWCDSIKRFKQLHLFDDKKINDFRNKTLKDFLIFLIGKTRSDDVKTDTADFLNVEPNSSIIKKLAWLGLFKNQSISLEKGTNADLLVDIMLKKMSYLPHEKDMTIVHNEVIARFGKKREKRISTMVLEGIPYGDSAMARSVSIPASIVSKRIISGQIKSKGVHIPVLPELVYPVLQELATFGITFKHKKINLE